MSLERSQQTGATPHGRKLINRVLVGEEKDRVEEARRLPQTVLTKELAKEVQNID